MPPKKKPDPASPVVSTSITSPDPDPPPYQTRTDCRKEVTSAQGITWVEVPQSNPASLGRGLFPFSKTSSDGKLALKDLEFRGRVSFVDLQDNPKFNHVIDVEADFKYINQLKQVVRSWENYPAADAKFNWEVLREGERTIRIVSKKDKQEPFASIWDATSTTDGDMYKLDQRSELSYDNVAVNSFVLVEAVPEIWTRQGVNGCCMHLLAIGLLKRAPSVTAKPKRTPDVDIRQLILESPKKKKKMNEQPVVPAVDPVSQTTEEGVEETVSVEQ
jgi:hypothetical protein